MIFVDTGAWYSYFVPTDPDSEVARAWFSNNREQLVTTDYIIDELLTLFRARGESSRAIDIGQQLWRSEHAELWYLSEQDLAEAWNVYRRYDDKDWSFTDCTSYALMKREGIRKAFAFDRHFRQFDGITVVP